MVISLLLAGCAAYVTPDGTTYIEPLVPPVLIGPPVIVPPLPHIVVRPLPPVFYYQDRPSLYRYNDLYYYRHGNGRDWYYGEHEKGPWHRLPEKYYPRHEKRYERSGESQQRGPGQGQSR